MIICLLLVAGCVVSLGMLQIGSPYVGLPCTKTGFFSGEGGAGKNGQFDKNRCSVLARLEGLKLT